MAPKHAARAPKNGVARPSPQPTDNGELQQLTVAQLKAKLQKAGLDTSGKKEDLVNRLDAQYQAAWEVGKGPYLGDNIVVKPRTTAPSPDSSPSQAVAQRKVSKNKKTPTNAHLGSGSNRKTEASTKQLNKVEGSKITKDHGEGARWYRRNLNVLVDQIVKDGNADKPPYVELTATLREVSERFRSIIEEAGMAQDVDHRGDVLLEPSRRTRPLRRTQSSSASGGSRSRSRSGRE